jgi:hypothetical protein
MKDKETVSNAGLGQLTSSLFAVNENHTKEAAYLAGFEANGKPDGTLENKELMSVKLLIASSHEAMAKLDLDEFKLVFPKKDARRMAAQLLAAAEDLKPGNA